MNTEHLRMPIEIFGALLRRCTTRRGCIQLLAIRSPEQFEMEFALKYRCLTNCLLSGVQSISLANTKSELFDFLP